ncbi:uncharacterized protein LOC109704172 [Ananas comosus]|uniref:Uncharacterized protein LOC109704172 n=1 Tax=Ananas comosus TaxID=4615 RepID=A0A6P5EGB7_ANACO|nr:uncharacterized protein LOC109704172 [Ananas comosus]
MLEREKNGRSKKEISCAIVAEVGSPRCPDGVFTRSNVVGAPTPAPAPFARTRSCVPLQMAVEEAHEKGSVLDRVARLEHRLAQLSLKMEGSSVSSSSTVHSSENPSLTIRRISSGREQFFSCQSFNDQFLECQDKSQQTVNTNNHSLQGEIIGDKQMPKGSFEEQGHSHVTEYPTDTRKNKKKNRKKKPHKSWRCKRLLGC